MDNVFVLQDGDISVCEKRAIRHASMFSKITILHSNANNIPITATPVGSVEFVQSMMISHGIKIPKHMSYPNCLLNSNFDYFKRKIWEDNIDNVSDATFVKPRHSIKSFTGGIKKNITEPTTDTLVWCSEPVEFLSEWRYYVANGEILGYARYDDSLDDNTKEPDLNIVTSAVTVMTDAGGPAGYSLDFGVLISGETALVEANDGWALGYYKGTCKQVDYAKLLQVRWAEIIK